jgi:hypothetical protein
MDTAKIISKYGLKTIERNGKTGVQPMHGKPTAADLEYIKAHMAEIIEALAPKPQAPIHFSDAEIARRSVDALEGKYRQLGRNGDTAAAIAARNAYNAALAEWTKQYPTAVATTVRYNDGATNNPWTN